MGKNHCGLIANIVGNGFQCFSPLKRYTPLTEFAFIYKIQEIGIRAPFLYVNSFFEKTHFLRKSHFEDDLAVCSVIKSTGMRSRQVYHKL